MASSSSPAAVDNTTNSNNNMNIVDFSTLLPQTQLDSMVRQWIDDDMPSFDVGGLVVGDSIKTAQLFLKSPGVVCGKPFFDAVFQLLNCTVEWNDNIAIEGRFIDASSTNKVCLATVSGPVHLLLRGERTALNVLSRCSGIASSCREALEIKLSHDWNGLVAGTRKTTPGFRLAEKYALLVGGVATHRLDLSQMVMLKDNHIWAAGSITKAVHLAKRAAGFSQKVEVECQNLDEAMEAAKAGADIVMLDNYSDMEHLFRDAKKLKEQYPHVLIEASGGITLETLGDYMGPDIDVISRSFTQGYPSVDYSLKIMK